MGWWFGRKGAPEAMACGYAPPPWLTAASDEGFARGYESQLSEVYRTNPVGLRSVRLVAGALGGLVVESGGGEAEDEAAARLAKGVLESAGAALLLHGNAFVQLIADSRGAPKELALLRPERVSIACDERGHASAYVYRIGGKAVRIAARDALRRRQVAHIRALNPNDDHLGLGCLDAAIAAASIHNRASRWNKALLDNAARPSGALSYEPGDGANLSGEQFDRLKAELAEQFTGATNAGRPLLLDGGLKWQSMALSPAEMDFVALKESAARDIALAFGVPPVLVGLPGLPVRHRFPRPECCGEHWRGTAVHSQGDDKLSETLNIRATMIVEGDGPLTSRLKWVPGKSGIRIGRVNTADATTGEVPAWTVGGGDQFGRPGPGSGQSDCGGRESGRGPTRLGGR